MALIMAAVPRLLASGTMVIVAFLLLKTREWIWVERLRLCMIITSLCAGISVAIDHCSFPAIDVYKWREAHWAVDVDVVFFCVRARQGCIR